MDLMKEECRKYEKAWKRIISEQSFGKKFNSLSFFDKAKILFDLS
jgi:SAM-dependent MidA family methyltransferase